MAAPLTSAATMIQKLTAFSTTAVVCAMGAIQPSCERYTGMMKPRENSTNIMMVPITTLTMYGRT